MKLVLLFLAAAANLAVAQTSDLSLGKPNASIEEPYSDAVGLVELRDGRVMVSDRIERTFSVADFGTRDRRTIGRNGIGPTEYQVPFGPIHWRGDTLLGYDPNNRRLLKITGDGLFVGSFSFPAPKVGGLNSWAPPRGVDPAGRIYWDSPIIDMQPVVKRSMKARIVRWLPGSDSIEVAQLINDHGEFEHEHRYRPMPQSDTWVIAPDGRIGVISAADYRLRWYKEGAVVETGPAVPFTPVRLTAAERNAYRDRKALEPGNSASANGAPMSRPPALGKERAYAAYPDSIFPEVMPPFEANGALLAPGGDIWVRRTTSAREAARVDVLDAHGKVRGVLRLPPHTRLFALGAEGIYLINTDDNGLQTLERHAYPASLKPR